MTDRTRSIASIAAQLALALPETFDYSETWNTHEDFTDTLAEFAAVVEHWARGQVFDNWYELVDALAAEFAAHPSSAFGFSAREWATIIDKALAKTPAEPINLPAAALKL